MASHKSISSFLVVLMLSFLFGQDVCAQLAISSPTAGTIWAPGTQVVISWSGSMAATSVNINLKKGSATNLQTVMQIASGINPNAQTSYSWSIPTTVATGTYAIEIGAPPNLFYSDQFTISGSGSSDSPSSTSSSSSSSTGSSPTPTSSPTTPTKSSHAPTTTINLSGSGNNASHNRPLNILLHLCISGFAIFLGILHF